jgi:hypothetical protein
VTVSNRRDSFLGVVWSTVGIASCCLKAMSAREIGNEALLELRCQPKEDRDL